MVVTDKLCDWHSPVTLYRGYTYIFSPMYLLSQAMDKVDIESFIREIENRPAIWDSRVDDFWNKVSKNKAWEEVSQKFVAGYKDMDNADKKQAGVYLLV